ncbi:periplasmic binding protein [Natrinema pellirubrum DSM 15624]|uniref:ABC-type Fe3+-hydroxamate transport system, periplasmic component n=1 Tax=Natrinema pellirubrum (strain DSM 15624 / CIP 106293 / JCM 10476 / NCIMB 786 / 157) TaxID=797303 RepID=L0JNE7_NATP1|nr:PGF-CTERM-anchored ABC transporter substrate-binding protein [Natrinema pellirubrum]AGB32117.1 ABC-type Fe3+-hydroxamate transport system, periplasmic component [Natrinema pellirubrum DSM 15624]ELY76998.1 periplasmic binding protein [Natrinema pellirubrum DSM 15624]
MRRQLAVILTVLLTVSAIGPAVAGAGTGTGAAVQDAEVQCDYPRTMTDATGEDVTIEDEPESVVTLYPGDAQLAYSIGAEDTVIGMPVSQYTESLEAGDRTDITGDDGLTPVAEEIINLNPDVVLAANIALGNADLREQLEDAGITVVVLDRATSLEDVRENVRVTGQVTGECDGAEETLQWMNERLEIYENALENESAPLAYYDGGESGDTHGTETFQHDVMTTAGLTNLAAETGQEGWGQMNSEVVVDANPEWIVYPDRTESPPSADALQGTTAVSEGKVVAVDDNAMSQPGPNVVYAIDTLIEAVHPEVYDDIEGDLEAVDGEYRDDGNESDGGSESDGDNESAIPGFGTAAALIALLAAAGFVARRR